jgi:DNA-binding HxlR family transcriptional regulator
MAARNYGQTCSVANFLDHLGSRWTLLIIRDLMIGPRRFKDLLEGLPSIGPNLLTARLRELQHLGIVQKDPVVGDSAGYVLTNRGWELEPVILAMAGWSLANLPPAADGSLDRPDLLVVAFRAAFQPVAASGVHDTYEFRIGDTTFFAKVAQGLLRTGLGAADQPDLVYITDSKSFRQIVNGKLSEEQARDSGLLKIVGDVDVYKRFQSIFVNPAAAGQGSAA